MHTKTFLLVLAVIFTASVMALQFTSTNQLRSEVAVLRLAMDERPTVTTEGSQEIDQPAERPRAQRPDLAGLDERLARLESIVAQPNRGSEFGMRRGPARTNQLQEIFRQLTDTAASDRDRLQALRQLRRGGPMPDDLVQQAIGWLQNSTNPAITTAILGRLNRSTNSALRTPLLELAANAADPGVREQSVEDLARFISDPEVEAQLWRTLLNDPSAAVRQQAANALADGPMTEARTAALRQRALSSEATVEEKLVALRGLNEAGIRLPEVTAALGELARTTSDSRLRLRLFREFDDLNDPVLKAPLVAGLRDSNPLVRERAVEALGGHRSDPAVMQWLRYVAENDTDSGVRREALGVLDED